MTTTHYDPLESRSSNEREAALMAALPDLVANAQRHSPAFADILKGVNAAAVTSRQARAALPVTRKHELLERQLAVRQAGGDVFGGFSALRSGTRMPRVFASPGPIYEPDSNRVDYWRMARAIHAAGFRPGQLI